jgi:hypothetical protein
MSSRERGAALAQAHAAALERADELLSVSRELILASMALCAHGATRRSRAVEQASRRSAASR